MTIADDSVELKQTTATKFVVNFGSATEIGLGDVAVDILIKGVDGVYKDACLVKDVKMAEDKKSAVVEMFYEFEDCVDYEVTVKGFETVTMTASNGTPAKAVLYANKDDINDRKVLVGTDAPIYFKLYDANDVEVETGSESANVEYHIKYANTDYETAGNTLFFNEVGDRAVVNIVYHTYDYDNVTGAEKGAFTSSAFTFVGVEKTAVFTKGINNYSVNGEEWRGANKNIVKMDDSGKWLQVKILLTDGKERTIDQWDAPLVAKDDVTLLGNVKFTSLNEDVLGIYKGTRTENGKDLDCYSLDPRKQGIANVKVSYVTNVNGVDVETNIATVAVKVSDKKAMNVVTPWATSTTIATNPVETTGSANFRNQTFGFTVKDQYGDDYGAYKINSIKGASNLSITALEKGAITNNGKTFTLNDAVFGDVLLANNKDSKGGSFFFNIEVQDYVNYGTKTFTFTVNARIVPKDAKTTLFIDVKSDILNQAGGNAARIQTNDGNNNNERMKNATFTVYEMYNGAKVNEVVLEGRKGAVNPVTNGYYYELKRNGSALVRDKQDSDKEFDLDKKIEHSTVSVAESGNGQAVTVNFNGIKNYVWYANPGVEKDIQKAFADSADYTGGIRIATYNNYHDVVVGAGTYEFVLWQATEKDGKLEYTRKLSKTLTATLDEGKYTFKFRNDVAVDVDSTTREGLSEALLGCFTIADRNGKTYDKNATGWNNIVDDMHVNIAGDTKLYFVNYKDVDATSVYVESIYFWEKVTVVDKNDKGELVGGDIETNDAGDTYSFDVYAEYVVPLGYYVTIR